MRAYLRNKLSHLCFYLARKLDQWGTELATCETCGRNPYHSQACYDGVRVRNV